jgi:hypothetical protein
MAQNASLIASLPPINMLMDHHNIRLSFMMV